MNSVQLVSLPNGSNAMFYPALEGGGQFEGRFDPNMEGPNGYVYGSVIVNGQVIAGYVCIFNNTFHALSEQGTLAIQGKPEVTVSQRNVRAGLTPATV